MKQNSNMACALMHKANNILELEQACEANLPHRLMTCAIDGVCKSHSTIIVEGRAQPQKISRLDEVKIMWNIAET